MGKDWLIPATLCRVQGQLEIAKIPIREKKIIKKHTSVTITTPNLPFYEISVRNSDIPAIRTVFHFFKKTKPGCFFKIVQKYFQWYH